MCVCGGGGGYRQRKWDLSSVKIKTPPDQGLAKHRPLHSVLLWLGASRSSGECFKKSGLCEVKEPAQGHPGVSGWSPSLSLGRECSCVNSQLSLTRGESPSCLRDVSLGRTPRAGKGCHSSWKAGLGQGRGEGLACVSSGL